MDDDNDDVDEQDPCQKKKPKKKPEDDEEVLKRMRDDEQAVLLNEPCPGACTIRRSRCCVVKPDPVEPPDCFEPFDYCSVEIDIPPPPPKKQCPTRDDKKTCPAKKNKYLAFPEEKPKPPEESKYK